MADRDGVFEHRAPIIYDPKTGGWLVQAGWLAGRCAWRAMSLRLWSMRTASGVGDLLHSSLLCPSAHRATSSASRQ